MNNLPCDLKGKLYHQKAHTMCLGTPVVPLSPCLRDEQPRQMRLIDKKCRHTVLGIKNKEQTPFSWGSGQSLGVSAASQHPCPSSLWCYLFLPAPPALHRDAVDECRLETDSIANPTGTGRKSPLGSK